MKPSGPMTHSEPSRVDQSSMPANTEQALLPQNCPHDLEMLICTWGFAWARKFRLVNGYEYNSLTKSRFLYFQLDLDLKNSCGFLIVCLGTLWLTAMGRMFWWLDLAMAVSLILLQEDTLAIRQHIPAYAVWTARLSYCGWALYKQYPDTIYTVMQYKFTVTIYTVNQTEGKLSLMHETEFFKIQDERLFLEHPFVMDFSYHFYFFSIICFFPPYFKVLIWCFESFL